MDDHQLLEEYALRGSDAAFTQLVERHLGLVHAAALRQVRDRALAADVAQAVFILLAQKAKTLRRGVVLTGWLFQTTRFIASRALRGEWRRQQREQEALDMQALDSTDPHWDRLAPELDEALAKLSGTDRDALLLRFAEGRNHREVGAALGLSEDAARKRVDRALERLRSGLTPHATGLSLLLLGSLLAERLVAAPSTTLVSSIAQGSLSSSASAESAARLAAETSQAWIVSRRIRLGAITAAVLMLGTLLVVWPFEFRKNGSSASVGTHSSSRLSSHTNSERRGGRPAAIQTFSLRVVAKESGNPLPGARVISRILIEESSASEVADLVTDAAGVCRVPLPFGPITGLQVGAYVPGREVRFLTWRSEWQSAQPTEYLLRLASAETIGGQVVDPSGRPVSGATIWFGNYGSDMSTHEPAEDYERSGLPSRISLGVTDVQGRWGCTAFAPSAGGWPAIEFEHVDYVPSQRFWPDAEHGHTAPSMSRAALRARTGRLVLQPAAWVRGQVVDIDGNPIPNAKVSRSWHSPATSTDATGAFSLGSLPPGPITLLATARHHAPCSVQAVAGGEAVQVVLQPPGSLNVQVLNPDGVPIPKAQLALNDGFDDGAVGWDDASDVDGWIRWDSAPRNQALNFWASAPGFQQITVSLRSDGSEQSVTLHPLVDIHGRVVDANTGEPIRKFKAIPAMGSDVSSSDRSRLRYATRGEYSISMGVQDTAIRIEAEGYQDAIGQPFRDADGTPRCDFKLHRVDSNPHLEAWVLNSDGTPAADTAVTLWTGDFGAQLVDRNFLKNEGSQILRTDVQGHAVFAWPHDAPITVLAISRNGFGEQTIHDPHRAIVQLHPFATIEGVALKNGRPASRQIILLAGITRIRTQRLTGFYCNTETTADTEGHFRFDGLPPGVYSLAYRTPGSPKLTDEATICLESGECGRVRMGEPDPEGATVIGSFSVSPKESVENWTTQASTPYLGRRVVFPEAPGSLSKDARTLWFTEWASSAAGRHLIAQDRAYSLSLSHDGRFTGRGLPPGDYELHLRVVPAGTVQRDPLNPPSVAWTGSVRIPVTIPAASPSSRDVIVDLGEIPISLRH